MARSRPHDRACGSGLIFRFAGFANIGKIAPLCLAAAAACTGARAEGAQPGLQPGLAAGGFTGLGITPSATPAGWGQILAAHDQALPGQTVQPRGHSFGLAVGLLPGLEVSGRLATQDLNCNFYGLGSNPCNKPGQRDLSASVKLGHRIEWQALPGMGLSAALGANDLGGAATQYRSYYGVLGLDRGPWVLHAGWARGASASAHLHGGFGSLAWRPTDWLQGHAEHSAGRTWLGGRVGLPAAWRPAGIEPWLGWQRSLQDDRFSPRQWWSVGLSVQLDRPARRSTGAGAQLDAGLAAGPSDPATGIATAVTGSATAAAAATPDDKRAPAAADPLAWAARLAARLAKAGFEDISLGQHRASGRVLVDAENSGYAWNDLDALGVAMGLVAAAADGAPPELALRLHKRGRLVWQVSGSAACIDRWLRGQSARCPGGQPLRLQAAALAQADAPADADIDWWLRKQRASWLRPRLMLSPDIDSRVGTEYGSFDSSWGLGLTLHLPLWQGAHADFAHVQALGHSADYDPGQAFSDFRIDSQSYRVMLHQALGLAPGLDARLAAGRLFKKLDGATAELRWQPGIGQHRLGMEVSEYSHVDIQFKKRSAMASYRYFVAPLQTSLELQGGRFWHGDRGAIASSRHWFGDVSVALYLRRSRFPEGSPALYSPYGHGYVNAAGLELSLPLTPRREHVGSLLQVRGTDRFSYGVQSVVGQKTSNQLTPWFGRFAPVPMGLAGTVDNFDRASQAYLDSNLHRLREAWARLPVD